MLDKAENDFIGQYRFAMIGLIVHILLWANLSNLNVLNMQSSLKMGFGPDMALLRALTAFLRDRIYAHLSKWRILYLSTSLPSCNELRNGSFSSPKSRNLDIFIVDSVKHDTR